MVKKSEAAVAVSEESQVAKFDDFSNVGQMTEFAKVLIASKMLPPAYNSPEKVVAAVVQGKELGMDAMTAINNLHVIQGKPTLSVHAIAALLKKAGVMYEIVKDYEPVYEKNDDGKEVLIDRITTIKFSQFKHDRWFENEISFTMKEAKKQDLTSKDNWKRMPNIMLRARALAIGARFSAPEALLGLYETSEYAEVKNVQHQVNDEGAVIINQ